MDGPRQNSKLSQVFLTTDWPCEKLADVLSEHKINSVLEIGPGKGILTESLLKRNFKVTCVERDFRFVKYLENRYKTQIAEGKLSLIENDILHFNFDDWRAELPGPIAICGNIPYHISSPLLERVLPQLGPVSLVVLLVQLEFAERLVSAPSVKSYGSLSIFAQLRSHLQIEAKVDRSCFEPIPKVDSAILSISPRAASEDPDLLRKVEKLTKLAFQQRRKKISNSLSKFLECVDKEKVGIDLSRRPDTLSPLEYLELAKTFRDSTFFDQPQ